MSHGAKAGAEETLGASGTDAKNSPFVHAIVEKLKGAPRISFKALKARIKHVIRENCVDAQLDFSHRFSLDLYVEMLAEKPIEARAEVANELHEPLGLVVSVAGKVADSASVNEALANVAAELGDVARLCPGGIEPHERPAFAREIRELEEALAVLKRLGGLS